MPVSTVYCDHLTDISDIIRHYDLKPHPEGGYYTRSYLSGDVIPPGSLPQFPLEPRVCSTAIIYLLPSGQKSHLHRLKQDEVWHFYLGSPLRLVMISPKGKYTDVCLGHDLMSDEHLQFVVPAGHWFGAAPLRPDSYSLLGCTVSPGFEYPDFELARPDHLIGLFPQLKSLVLEFTSTDG